MTFYYDRGVPLQFEDDVAFYPRIESNLQADLDQELLSTDPLSVRVTVTRDGDELRDRFDAARQQGITGLPTFTYDGQGARGAVPPEHLERLVEGG